MANLIGALVGAALDRQDGDSGIKGAIAGTLAESAVRVPDVRMLALADVDAWRSIVKGAG